MALQHLDYNDILPSNAARGRIFVREFSTPSSETHRESIIGAYLDPISSRLDEVSQGRYYNNPVPSWVYGRSDDTYQGQRRGNITISVANIFQHKDSDIVNTYKGNNYPESGWKEMKITTREEFSKDSCYTNLPAKY